MPCLYIKSRHIHEDNVENYLHKLEIIQVFDKGCQTPDCSVNSGSITALIDDAYQLPQQLWPVVWHIPFGDACRSGSSCRMHAQLP